MGAGPLLTRTYPKAMGRSRVAAATSTVFRCYQRCRFTGFWHAWHCQSGSPENGLCTTCSPPTCLSPVGGGGELFTSHRHSRARVHYTSHGTYIHIHGTRTRLQPHDGAPSPRRKARPRREVRRLCPRLASPRCPAASPSCLLSSVLAASSDRPTLLVGTRRLLSEPPNPALHRPALWG